MGDVRSHAAPLRTTTVALGPVTGARTEVGAGAAGVTDVAPESLKRTAVRGAVISTVAQAATLVLRTASLVVLARLLLREDFGLVTMVTACTGFLGLMYAGLSMATVQKESITPAQISALFWVNLAVGGLLALVAAVMAPMLTTFYGEPRLFWLTVVLGTNFIFSGATVQHRALLQRSMRFSALAVIDIAAIVASTTVGIGLALAGYGYWALVAMTVSHPLVTVLGAWLATGWVPALPQGRAEIRSMLAYGGAVTLTNLVVYVAYNADKVLIGRFWGAEALGIYGRAYQLINLPIDNLNSTIGLVAVPALARIQNDAERLGRYFLGGYGLFQAVIMPATIGCALLADDIVLVFLGPKWHDVANIFRLLAPAVLAFGFANPFIWLMLAGGRAGRALKLSLVVTPVLILSYALGLSHGPQGVAIGFSVTMALAVVPVVLWATRGTSVTMRDVLRAVAPAAISIATGATALLTVRPMLAGLQPAFVRLVAESTVLFGAYLFTLLFVMNQKSIYLGLLRDTGLRRVSSRGTAAS